MPFRLLALVLLAALSGCANPGIVQISPDTYMLSRDDHGGIFGNANRLKASVIQEANDFAAKQGKIAVPLESKQTPVGGPGQWASFEYQFRVVDKNDPEAVRSHLKRGPDRIIEQNINKNERTHITTDAKPDLYTELMKLNELKKQGIITEEEFQVQKKKLMGQ